MSYSERVFSSPCFPFLLAISSSMYFILIGKGRKRREEERREERYIREGREGGCKIATVSIKGH